MELVVSLINFLFSTICNQSGNPNYLIKEYQIYCDHKFYSLKFKIFVPIPPNKFFYDNKKTKKQKKTKKKKVSTFIFYILSSILK